MRITALNTSKRVESPKFDFLKTISLPTTPQPQKIKEKRMFLSLYKSIHRQEVKPGKDQNAKVSSQPPKRHPALAIEGLVPVPPWKRVERKRVTSAKKNKNEVLMKVRVHSRNITPIFNRIDLDY
jgi:hypothetical protein